MVPTKKTLMTWATETDLIANIPEFQEEKRQKIAEMIAMGQTNEPNGIYLSPTVYQREWSDEAAALEWKAWLEDAKLRWNLGLISIAVEDI